MGVLEVLNCSTTLHWDFDKLSICVSSTVIHAVISVWKLAQCSRVGVLHVSNLQGSQCEVGYKSSWLLDPMFLSSEPTWSFSSSSSSPLVQRDSFFNHWNSKNLLLYLMHSSEYVLFGISFVLWFLQHLAFWDWKAFSLKLLPHYMFPKSIWNSKAKNWLYSPYLLPTQSFRDIILRAQSVGCPSLCVNGRKSTGATDKPSTSIWHHYQSTAVSATMPWRTSCTPSIWWDEAHSRVHRNTPLKHLTWEPGI